MTALGHPPDLATHRAIDPRWVGRVTELGAGSATAELETRPEMAADDRGLVHGGFVFGLADFAAMAAVNDPHVVLGASRCRFTRPVAVGQTVVAQARVTSTDGRRHEVEVTVHRSAATAEEEGGADEVVLSAELTCFVLDAHVLDG